METQQVQELKAERVQEEIVGLIEEPFTISLKAERVQAPVSVQGPISAQVGGTVSLAYEMSFNQMKGVTVELNEPQIVVHLFATGGQEAA